MMTEKRGKSGSHFVCLLLFASILLLTQTFGQAKKEGPTTQRTRTFPDEAKAHDRYRLFLRTWQEAQSITFDSDYRWQDVEGKELSSCTFRVELLKPSYARVEAIVGGRTRGILVGDGQNFWIYWNRPKGRPRWSYELDEKEYAKTRFNSYMKWEKAAKDYSLAHEIQYLGAGTTMTVTEPSVFHGYDDPMEAYLDSVRSQGTEVVDGQTCDIIQVSFMAGQRLRALWLAKDNLPRRLNESILVAGGTIEIEERLSNVKLNQPIPVSRFTWTPPDKWVQWHPRTLEENLLTIGTPAPDFNLRTIGGSRLRLSAFRGKVVLLNFFRAG